ncbi:sarcosine oxidase subunit gamma [Phreatobacter sp. AB_2022a]|uniref:sarcosine oxidase subunit gamma n=1 Tax=Phreatobacter sp. AB_2022a TaxID=3003134 RepID=UPI0022872081|nr:sarcosine oxidase subunit gamma family protein [Phreatobacter sp. AB_2022a]MCZ0738842.1 sarcosine oxidase subunit gamma [Phreatobacter sp. AB_2022a]
MAEAAAIRPAWAPQGAWADILAAGRHGAAGGGAGLTVTPLEGFGLALVLADRDPGAGGAAAVLQGLHGAAPPRRPRLSTGTLFDLVAIGPGRWLAVSADRAIAATLAAALGSHGAVSDQSDGLALVRLAGPAVRSVLAKGCPVDLHRQAFAVGAAAATMIGHVNTTLWRRPDRGADPVFELAVTRSMAGSLGDWLLASAAADGCAITEPAGPG